MPHLISPSVGIACVATAALLAAAPALASPLHAAVQAQDIATVQTLLADPDRAKWRDAIETRDAQGRTPLLLATALDRVAIAQRLIDAGADVNAQDTQRDTPYLLAGTQGRLAILRMTLAHGADLRSTNRYGGTALIPAAERGHVETVRTLIAAGVPVDHINRLGWTALLEAIVLSDGGPAHQDIVRQLIAAGADVNLADHGGVTPLRHAEQRGYGAIATLLRAAGAR